MEGKNQYTVLRRWCGGSKPMKHSRGFSIIEALVASAISMGAIAVTTFIYFSGMGSWAKGQGDIDSMASSQVIVKKVAKELQEAISVQVSATGLRVDYQLPAKDGSGNYSSPAVSDNVSRSFVVTGGNLIHINGPDSRILATNMVLKNPANNQNFVPFQGDGNVISRRVQIAFATEKEGQIHNKRTSCVSETIYLRNIPRKKS